MNWNAPSGLFHNLISPIPDTVAGTAKNIQINACRTVLQSGTNVFRKVAQKETYKGEKGCTKRPKQDAVHNTILGQKDGIVICRKCLRIKNEGTQGDDNAYYLYKGTKGYTNHIEPRNVVVYGTI